MKDHELLWNKKGGIRNRRGMKNKEDEYSQWVWLYEVNAVMVEIRES